MSHKTQRRARRLRREIIDRLGAWCDCCGESIRAGLTIDHRRDDGAAHRRQFPDLRALYRDILEQGCPRDRFRVLCRVCHESKNERGECAHVAEVRSICGLDRASERMQRAA